MYLKMFNLNRAGSFGLVAPLLALILLTACSEQSNEPNSTDHIDKISTTKKINESYYLSQNQFARVEQDFNFNWKFSLTDNITDSSEAYQNNFDDSKWRDVRLPHDWSIEAQYSQIKTAGATGYLPGGEGWYRKSFPTPQGNKVTQILFDGIYNHSKVWVNGHLLGERPYGYAPFYYDLTPYLHQDGKDNTIAVYVDRTRYIDSRWYTGSGIYRNVKLITTNATYIPVWGTYITTPVVTQNKVTVQVETAINSIIADPQDVNVLVELYDPSGKPVAKSEKLVSVTNGQITKIEQQINLNNHQRWDIESPHLYTAQTTLMKGKTIIDQHSEQFGIRTFKNDPKTGFSLNGKNIKIKGVNLHHDAGLVGSAVPKGVWKRRLALLKEAGVNAIRTAHNPPSAEFLQLCDEMGFLVQDEVFDEWENPKDKRKNFNNEGEVDYITQSYSQYFSAWAERDLKAMVMRDRNHPSIFQWSIGNEIEWTYPRYGKATGYWDKDRAEGVNYYWTEPPFSIEKSKQVFNSTPANGKPLADTAKELSVWVKELDTTRPVTANLVIPSVGHFSGYTDALDVVGYSYRQAVYDYGHKNYPDKMIMGTENWVQWHEWQYILERDYIPGVFVWTGADYLGESNGKWPKKGSNSGMIDFAGFAKPSFHMMKTLWNDEPHLFITTQTLDKSLYQLVNSDNQNKATLLKEKEKNSWKRGKWSWRDVNEHWQYEDNEMVIVEVYANVEEVELFLNGRSLGIKSMADNPEHILKWAVPYQAGELSAKAVVKGKKVSTTLVSALAPAAIKLTADRKMITADGYDVSHIVAQLVDKNGNEIKHTDAEITFEVKGEARVLGVDNGAFDNIQKHQSNSIITSKGRALMILQSKLKANTVQIKATAKGLTSGEAIVVIE